MTYFPQNMIKYFILRLVLVFCHYRPVSTVFGTHRSTVNLENLLLMEHILQHTVMT